MSSSPDLSRVLPRVLIVSRRTVRKNKFVDFVGESLSSDPGVSPGPHRGVRRGAGDRAARGRRARAAGLVRAHPRRAPLRGRGHRPLPLRLRRRRRRRRAVGGAAGGRAAAAPERRGRGPREGLDRAPPRAALPRAQHPLPRHLPRLAGAQRRLRRHALPGRGARARRRRRRQPHELRRLRRAPPPGARAPRHAAARVVRRRPRRRPRVRRRRAGAADGEQLPPPGRAAAGAAVRAHGVRAGRAGGGLLRPRRVQPRRGQVHHGPPVPPRAHAQARLRRVRLPRLRQGLPGVRPRRRGLPGQAARRGGARAPERDPDVAEDEQGDGEAAQGHLPELLACQGHVPLRRRRPRQAGGGAAGARRRRRVPRVEQGGGAERAAGEAAEADGRDGAERVGVPQQPEGERGEGGGGAGAHGGDDGGPPLGPRVLLPDHGEDLRRGARKQAAGAAPARLKTRVLLLSSVSRRRVSRVHANSDPGAFFFCFASSWILLA